MEETPNGGALADFHVANLADSTDVRGCGRILGVVLIYASSSMWRKSIEV